MPTLAHRAVTATYDASFTVSSLNVAAPSGTVSSDMEEMWVGTASIYPTAAPTVNALTGWTNQGNSGSLSFMAQGVNARLTLLTRTGTTVQTESVSISSNGLISIVRRSAQNPNSTGYFGQVSFGQLAAATTLVVPGITTVRNNSMVSWQINQLVAQTITPPGDLTERFDNASTGISIHDRIITSPSATGNKSFTVSSSAPCFYGVAEYYSANTYTLPADPKALTLAGQTVGLKKDWKLDAATKALTLAGQAVGLTHDWKLFPAPYALTLAGQNVSFKRDYNLTAATYALVLNGIPVDLIKSNGDVIMPTTTGALTLSGISVDLLKQSRLFCDTGSLNLSGISVNLLKQAKLLVNTGNLTLSGISVNLFKQSVLFANTGAFSIAGNPVNLSKQWKLATDVGSLILNGIPVSLVYSGTPVVPQHSYVWDSTWSDEWIVTFRSN